MSTRRTTSKPPTVTTMRLQEEDWAALRRILERNPVIRTNTDAVRHAIHFTDKAESQVAA